MSRFRWCSRCHAGFDVSAASLDSRGDLYCPECGASSVYLMHWDYARSLNRHFPECPDAVRRYEPESPAGTSLSAR